MKKIGRKNEASYCVALMQYCLKTQITKCRLIDNFFSDLKINMQLLEDYKYIWSSGNSGFDVFRMICFGLVLLSIPTVYITITLSE